MQIHLILNGMRILKTEVEKHQWRYAKQRKENFIGERFGIPIEPVYFCEK